MIKLHLLFLTYIIRKNSENATSRRFAGIRHVCMMQELLKFIFVLEHLGSSFDVGTPRVVASQARLDDPQTVFCFRPCCGEHGFIMVYFIPKRKPFQTSQLTICWELSFLIPNNHFGFPK